MEKLIRENNIYDLKKALNTVYSTAIKYHQR